MPKFELDFEVFCAQCGAGLCNNCSEGTTRGRGMPFIQVQPCEKCLSDAEETGERRGYDEGYEKAESEQKAKA